MTDRIPTLASTEPIRSAAGRRPQNMIGQHGSLTDAERIVPLVRLGAFAVGG